MARKSSNFGGILAILGILIYFASKLIEAIFNLFVDNIFIIIFLVLSILGIYLGIQLYFDLYFKSKKFIQIKNSIIKHTNNCNELNHYIQELKCSYVNIESYNYGVATMTDNSVFNFQRREWNNTIQSNKIHNCSASVCKNASDQPIKYLFKYFNIEKNEESLSKFEKVLNDFTSVEQGKDLLKRDRDSIIQSISNSIPFLIKKHRNEKLIEELGFETVDISETYIPKFTFQYVSAGGYSSSKCEIKLNLENLNSIINYLNSLIEWSKSVSAQRALMTSQLREKIKERDSYKCCLCGLGITDEPNLLLEIDHIIPISKGGITSYDNLQTLCWRCNRTKGTKILQ